MLGSTGKNLLEKVRCANLSVENSTGKIDLKDVVTTGNIDLQASTGDVIFEDMDCGNLATCHIDIETDTGDIKGSLLSGKTFQVTKDSGRATIPESVVGAPICKLKTDTGNIKITVKS